ncbi:hypothetical protein MCAMS1_00603 [biofilm metagenome]
MDKARTAVIKKPELPTYLIAIILALSITVNVALPDDNEIENTVEMTAY